MPKILPIVLSFLMMTSANAEPWKFIDYNSSKYEISQDAMFVQGSCRNPNAEFRMTFSCDQSSHMLDATLIGKNCDIDNLPNYVGVQSTTFLVDFALDNDHHASLDTFIQTRQIGTIASTDHSDDITVSLNPVRFKHAFVDQYGKTAITILNSRHRPVYSITIGFDNDGFNKARKRLVKHCPNLKIY